jgi:SNF2 family DNA or RNA helicase
MIITSKYHGACNTCSKAYQPGDRIDWVRTIRGASHAGCTEAGRATIKAQEASRATEVSPEIAVNLPCPEGQAYLGYQRAGIAYALSHGSTLIADEMGLGKTVQAIGVINASPTVKTVCIVCPASLKLNWKRECVKWLARPSNIGIVGERDSVGPYPPSGGWPVQESVNIRIINYDVLSKLPKDATFDLIIVDEAHYAKNSKAQRTKNLQAIAKRTRASGGRVLLLTGTPILNKPIELWTLLQMVSPEVWDPPGNLKGRAVGAGEGAGFFRFAKRYCDAHQEWVSRTKQVWIFDGSSNLPELQERLRETCMVRRLKADVLRELPPKRRQVIELSPTDADGNTLAWDEVDVDDDYESAHRKLAKIGFEDFSAVRHAQALSKVPAVIDHVREVLESTAKVVLFAHHKDVIAQIMAGLSDANPVKLDGDMDQASRQASVDAFQNDPSVRVFVGSLKAAGVGLTLTAASTVIFAELDWTPATLSQAEDRCHRIGQTDSVLVQHLVLQGTLDAKMARMITEKQDVADAALDNEASYTNEGREVVETREARRARMLKEASLTEARVSEIHAQLRFLAARCDGAQREDGQGFNKLDSNIGHQLADQRTLSPKQALMAEKILTKYRRQLQAMPSQTAAVVAPQANV